MGYDSPAETELKAKIRAEVQLEFQAWLQVLMLKINEIAEKDSAIAEKDTGISAKDTEIAKRDHLVHHLKKAVQSCATEGVH